MTRKVAFVLAEYTTPLLNQTLRMHWRARQRAHRDLAWRIRIALAGQRQVVPAPPFGRALVEIERHSLGVPDLDGLVGGLKSLIDCLLPSSKLHPCGLGILVDDIPLCMDLRPASVRAAHRALQCMRVTITEAGRAASSDGA